MILLLALALLAPPVPTSHASARAAPIVAQTGYARLSPFEMVRWNGDVPEVLVRGAWWRLEAIDGVTTKSILASARRDFGDDWAKRFCEDLVEVMTRAGHAPPLASDLAVVGVADAKPTVLEDVAWTAENRRRVRDARPRPGASDAAAAAPVVTRLVRERSSAVPPALEPLTRRIDALESSAPSLTRAQAAQDLEQLEWLVQNAYAYRDRVGYDHRAAFDALHARLGDSISRTSFALCVHRLLCGFGDGHTRLRESTTELFVPGSLPVRLARDEHGVVAIGANGAPLDAAHPYLAAIDGEPIDAWFGAVRVLVPRGSSAFEDRGALQRVVHVAHLRAERRRPARPDARLVLASRAGERVERDVELVASPVRAAEGERLVGRRLANDVGYLRIGRMDDDAAFLARLDGLLDELAGVRGLVVDVRGNGGGTRHALLALAPRVLPRTVDAVVVNVAALRVAPGEDASTAGAALADRFLYPADRAGWSDAARAAIARVESAFAARTPLDPSAYTRWHHLVLERDARREPLTEGRVAVLSDAGCFSATDVFLGALAELPNASIVGMPSGGGSGRARSHVLANSGLEVQLSTMVSYRPDGSAYDGCGIEPDVRVVPTLDDLLGRTDSALDRATALVSER